ncbi:PREDICTED: thaumatin-like protein 1b isoform X2 [Camelina sativa]|uniref:Thaumatin-like protein 1b isoform X2 n=1 Tax=Camelina sativa TaxID=90675 RepID=A0ABM0UCN0_CAMSA|nr:PREDICTED: thaumatin-like protein 1b isoform X2 [Camelina sativa]
MTERLPLIVFLTSHLFISGVLSMSILTIENKCNNTVWPVIFSWDSHISTTGFALRSGEARALLAPSSWYGLISARTLCSSSTEKFSCLTGDCESGKIECPGTYDWSPVTYAYFIIDKGGIDSYFISVAHGYNLPLMVIPSSQSSRRTCISSGCVVDLNKTCPNDLKTLVEGKPIACTSACHKSKTDENCCTGDFESKQKCKPTVYTQNFERACPSASSYAYENSNNTFVCPNSTDFTIRFCPSSNIPENTRSSMAPLPLAGPNHNSLPKLKPIFGTTVTATTSLLLIHIFKKIN